MTVFADTSALYAAIDRDDENHEATAAAMARLLSQAAILLTNNYVLLETCALLQRRLGPAAFRVFQQDVFPLLTVEWITERRHRARVEAALAAARRKLRVVDCVSFQSMREGGVRTAFCFDPHFREQGFELVP
ncbi:MAG: PIN domain-containing protein [Acidobacteriia bacterium]|nr:PIN domain-containing protein [Terriglobia bacterium]